MSRDLVDIMGGGRGRAPERTRFDDEAAQRSNLTDLDMVLHHQTKDAVLVSDTGEEARAVWLPKSQIEFARLDKNSGAVKKDGQRTVLPVVTVTMPEWLAKEKGLI